MFAYLYFFFSKGRNNADKKVLQFSLQILSGRAVRNKEYA